VLQRKTKATDGYDAVQLGFGEQKERRVTRAALGRFRKAGSTPRRFLAEFGVDGGEALKAGDTVSVAVFEGTPYVDVTGISKGLGFQGVVRRHRMAGGPATHGGHSKRRIGSIGANSFPARVEKGKRMPGRAGRVRVTQQNLRVVDLRPDDHVLLVEGAVPGPTGGIVLVRKALKRAGKAS
jgi:large subunit ribosomal protein L3